LENWTEASVGTERWHQYWIGANGIPARYVGVLKDGAMRYEGEEEQGASKVRSRLTFFNLDANTVRQLSEQSSDGGKTWTTSTISNTCEERVSEVTSG
jgi:hypothetical protein